MLLRRTYCTTQKVSEDGHVCCCHPILCSRTRAHRHRLGCGTPAIRASVISSVVDYINTTYLTLHVTDRPSLPVSSNLFLELERHEASGSEGFQRRLHVPRVGPPQVLRGGRDGHGHILVHKGIRTSDRGTRRARQPQCVEIRCFDVVTTSESFSKSCGVDGSPRLIRRKKKNPAKTSRSL